MSLAPREQRLLARIEHSLRSTDPRLARMLATFRLPAFRGGLAHLCRSRGRDFIPPALALVAISLIICCGLLLGHTGPVPCPNGGSAVASYRGGAVVPVNTCRVTGGLAKKSGPSTSSRSGGGRGAVLSATRLPGGL